MRRWTALWLPTAATLPASTAASSAPPRCPAGQVALVVGGGSGHYPAFAGLVGPGLAAASACGNMFASPAAGQVYRVAKAANAGGGVLLSYGNYAGDVLHFGQAQLRLNAEGIETRTVLVTDDIASAPLDQIEKRRGIAGDLTVFKIAGAAAEAGLDLDDVERLAIRTNYRTRSLGVAFDGCTLPGAGEPLFSVPAGQMSLGLGIHGEPGISEHPMPTASELAELLVSRLLADKPDDAGNRVVADRQRPRHRQVRRTVPALRQDREAAPRGRADRRGTRMRRAGHQPGHVRALPDPAVAGRRTRAVLGSPGRHPGVPQGQSGTRAPAANSPDRGRGSGADVERPTAAAAELGRLAAAVLAPGAGRRRRTRRGTGQPGCHRRRRRPRHRHAPRRGRRGRRRRAGRRRRGASAERVLTAAGEAWSERAGGTSGALWGSAVIAAGLALGNRDSYRGGDAAAAVTPSSRHHRTRQGRAGRQDHGGRAPAVPGHVPHAFDGGATLSCALAAAAAAARTAADRTADLRPLKGRARPLAEKSLGHPDPGGSSSA